ncbi:MAG: M20/M25/M40 family metallo-hydrolase [Ferruginibacter sp.]
MFKPFIIFMCCLFSTVSYSQNKDSVTIKKLADEILLNSTAYENLRFLCKKVGPRLSGSPNAANAVLATAKMLKDAGADTVYLQPCLVPHWIRGAKETGYVEGKSGVYNLRLCAIGNTVGTGLKGVKSDVIEVKSMDALNKLGSAVKGKIVFFNIAMDPRHIRTFRAYGESGTGRRLGPAQASKYGAIGVMIRSLASNIDEFPHTGATRYNDSFPKIPAVAISTKDAEWLSKELKSHGSVKAYFRTNCKMLPDAPSFNVIGEIKGLQFPQEIITVGGHLDSWDLGEGAQDDGAGCVQSIEIIRALKSSGIIPKRTIRAVMFMNEENGGAGGDKYLEEAKRKKENHVFALESDAGGFSPRGFSLEMNESSREKIGQWKNLFYNYSVYEFVAGGSGSDIESLKEIGTALAGLVPDSQRYFDLHHAATDTFEAVSKRELDLGAVTMATLVWLVSEYGL